MVWIKYFVPEDGDDMNHPNVFKVDGQSNEISVGQITKAFPLPGQFHFRFLKSIANTTVWLDIVDNSSSAPSHQGGVFVKASRIEDNATSSTATPTTKQQNTSTAQAPVRSNTAPVVKPPKPTPTIEKKPSEKLLNFGDEVPAPTTTTATQQNTSTASPFFEEENDLLGMSATTSANQQTKSNTDLFGLEFSSQPISTNSPMMNSSSNLPNIATRAAPTGFAATGMSQQAPNNVRGSMTGGMAGGMMGGQQGAGQAFDPFGSLTGIQGNNNNSNGSGRYNQPQYGQAPRGSMNGSQTNNNARRF